MTDICLRSEIHNGKNTLFWFDDWLEMGKLIDIAGESSTQVMGIHRYATVASVASSGSWNLRRCRSSHLRAMITRINSVPPTVEEAGSDRMLGTMEKTTTRHGSRRKTLGINYGGEVIKWNGAS